jgi:hypothetical protein
VTRTLAPLAALVLALALAACQGTIDDHGSQADAGVSPPDGAPVEPDAAPHNDPPDAAPPVDNCGGITSHCLDGETVETCQGGQLVQTSCTGGQICDSDGAGGAGCFDPPTTGDNVVKGTVRYEDRPPQSNGSLGAVVQVVARGVSVSLVQDSGSTVLATGRTKDDGTYELGYTVAAGTMVHVTVAATSDVAERPIKVRKLNNSIHGFGGASFAAAASLTKDVLVTQASNEAEAFNIFDQMVAGCDAVRVRMGVTSIDPIDAFWQPGSTQGTFYDGSLNLLGASDDDDGYDDAVILHEFGHYVEDTYGRSDNPGGDHNGSADDPRLAWSEGWSTYFSSVTRGNLFYMDSSAGGGFAYNLDTQLTKANGSQPVTQLVSENMVSQILWDIGDGGAANDDDQRSDGDRHDDLLKVQTLYLKTGVTATRGVQGVDLVDGLDGWFKKYGTVTCAALKSIAQTHTYPYDFKAPGATCP